MAGSSRFLPIFQTVSGRYVKTASSPACTTVAISQFAFKEALFGIDALGVLPVR
jgi:hypothetical protein